MKKTHFKMNGKVLFTACLLGIVPMQTQSVFAKSAEAALVSAPQAVKITGKVVDAVTGDPIVGCSVIVKGSNAGTITDVNGNFKLETSDAAVLTVSYIGYLKTDVKASAGGMVIKLNEDSRALDEVVVTALGIKREKKALGYAMQEVKGDLLLAARETNVANALSGKVAGLQIIRSSNGPAGSSKINIRGYNSLTGSNQPLIVVDGVPMDNFAGASNNDYWNPSPDMGNGLSDINPDDIESMSVLKGASAAALYGSRAGNGVILVTTKSGKKQQGLGVTVSGTVGFETLFMRPKYQNSFGQGENGVYLPRSGSSWGPEITGQSVQSWDGSTVNMAAYDNVSNYFDKPGVNLTENITFQQAFDKTSVYSSFTRLDDKSLIPGAKLNRTNMMLRTLTKFGKNDAWEFDAKIQYFKNEATNRPLNGHNDSNSFLTMYLLPRSMDITGFSAQKKADGNMLWYDGAGKQMNPYWMADNCLATDSRDRFLMNASVKYKFNAWLNAEVRAGRDMHTTTTENKKYGLSPDSKTGRYSYEKKSFFENNFSALLTAKKDNLIDRLGVSAQVGGNLMHTVADGIKGDAGELLVPNLFSLSNPGNGKSSVSENYSTKKINSIYGTFQLNWDSWAFLDGTFRNDWTSALSKDNRSFFYPSVNASIVVTDMLSKFDVNVPTWLTFAKIRASHAQVGNDMDPYQLYNVYSMGTDPANAPVASSGKVLYNPDVKNELIKSSEIGTELRFLNNRFSLDVAWYKSNATNQLLNLAMDPLSGYTSRKVNVGDVQNKGMEFMLNAKILDNSASLTWDMTVNTSFNENKIISLAPQYGINTYPLATFENMKFQSVEGSLYGDIYGSTFLRVKDGVNAGKLLLTAEGLPQATPDNEPSFLGNQQASALLGITNAFAYKGFNFSFLVDARFGGKIYSGTNQAMQLAGTAAETVVNGKRDNFVVDGVISDGNGGYKQSTIAVTPEKYWGAVAGSGNLGIGEANMYDASNIRLRNIQFGYTFNRKMLTKTPFQSIKLGVTCNNVWMISSHMKGVDPESVYAAGTNAAGFEYSSAPTTRSYMFNIALGF